MSGARNPSARRAGRAGWIRSNQREVGTTERKYTPLIRCHRSNPCPICGKPDWCSMASDSSFVICMRVSRGSRFETRNGGYLHRCGALSNLSPLVYTAKSDASIIRSVESRHAVYSALLERLTLRNNHATDLVRRGLSEETITRNLYSTAPAAAAMNAITAVIGTEHDCVGVPGFWYDGSIWRVAAERGALLIPVRDAAGLIAGITVRSANPNRRYRWLSSGHLCGGVRAAARPHFALRRPAAEGGVLIVTEGALKADVILELVGINTDGVIGLPGVGAAHGALERLLRDTPALNRIIVAFDADFRTNGAVAAAAGRLVRDAQDLDIRVDVATWDPSAGKGLDDVLAAGVRV
jgi:hypothetical protein